jgi:hypothetical protein
MKGRDEFDILAFKSYRIVEISYTIKPYIIAQLISLLLRTQIRVFGHGLIVCLCVCACASGCCGRFACVCTCLCACVSVFNAFSYVGLFLCNRSGGRSTLEHHLILHSSPHPQDRISLQ